MLKRIKYFFASLSGDNKSMLVLVGGTTLAQILNILFAPIQTRLFSPKIFGELSVFTSITGIISVIVCLRYELAIVLPSENDEGFELLKLSCFFAFIISIVSLIALVFFGEKIYSLFKTQSLFRYWYYLPITLMLTGIIQSANYWLIRRRNFMILSYNKVLPVVAINFVSIGLGLLGNCSLGARLLSLLIGNIVNVIILVLVIFSDPIVKKKNNIKKLLLIKRYKSFLVYDIWSALINNLSWMIVPILINTYYGSYEAGQYSIGLRVIQIPASIIGSSIHQVFLKTASEKRYEKTLFLYTKKITKNILIFTIPFAIFLVVFGENIFIFVFGSQWKLAGTYTQILAPWALVWFLSSPISSIYTILQKQNISLITSSLNLVTRFLALLLGKHFGSDVIGILLFSFSGFIINCLSLYFCFILAKRNDS